MLIQFTTAFDATFSLDLPLVPDGAGEVVGYADASGIRVHHVHENIVAGWRRCWDEDPYVKGPSELIPMTVQAEIDGWSRTFGARYVRGCWSSTSTSTTPPRLQIYGPSS
jgi:hypothetical protein